MTTCNFIFLRLLKYGGFLGISYLVTARDSTTRTLIVFGLSGAHVHGTTKEYTLRAHELYMVQRKHTPHSNLEQSVERLAKYLDILFIVILEYK